MSISIKIYVSVELLKDIDRNVANNSTNKTSAYEFNR